MKRRVLGAILGLTLSAVLAVTSSVPSFAAEDFSAELEEAVIEEVQEEITEDEEATEEVAEEASEEASEETAEDEYFVEPEEETVSFDVEEAVEEVTEDTEEADLTEEELPVSDEEITEPIADPAKEPVQEPEEGWKNAEYTVVFHANTGKKDIKEKKTFKVEDKDQVLSTAFTKQGYRLTSWSSKKPEFKVAVDATVDALVKNYADANSLTTVDLYADWEQNEYSIVFFDNDGNKLEAQPLGNYSLVKYEEKVNFISAATQMNVNLPDGVTIKGFSKTKEGDRKIDFALNKDYSKLVDVHEGTLEVYPVLGEGEYTINMMLDSNVTLSKKITSYKSGKKVTLPTAKKTGYKFLGWVALDSEGNPLSEEALKELEDVYATKTVKDADGNQWTVVTAIKKTAKQTVYIGSYFEALRFKISIDPNGKGVERSGEEENIALKKKTYWATFDYDGEPKDMAFTPEVSRKGYTLVGFSLKKKIKSEADLIDGDDFTGFTTKAGVTIYCIWQANPYNVYYMNSAAACDPAAAKKITDETEFSEVLIDGTRASHENYKEETKYFGSVSKLTPATYPGCKFLGWMLADGCAAKVATDRNGFVTKVLADNEEDLFVYAVFAENSYKLKFNTNGGTILVDGAEKKGVVDLMNNTTVLPVKNAKEINDAIATFTGSVKREGYKCVGVALDAKGKKPVTEETVGALSKKANSKVTLYAIWEKDN
ncbi:InlB B-repeat-containing protein [Butyrivibrio sp. DSM 10294]|uniref:InlB B-repeat-containing protein n=1 Tax=Butyrivibrio sp. DSM 10294 TaxID=2972457 RepID=UPI00234E716F|nr:InlB B-repeat-containing protein [Butyrivibrio sp. DSM 10294]MDC7292684.1 InlB B-repeat-containing protein [Butyrivibrio sp. DSM 10294]